MTKPLPLSNIQEQAFKEELLYHIWDGRHITNNLKTVSGKRVKLIFTGHFNTGKGPDFKNAVFKLNGEYMRGDVEVHVNTYDWVNHNHYLDSNYNRVILHVVYNHNSALSYSIKENGELLEILELNHVLDSEIGKLLERYSTDTSLKEKSCRFFNGITAEQLIVILKRIGIERFKAKINRFDSLLLFSNFNQVLYQGILETCGYSKNKVNMITLSELFTWNELRDFANNNSYESTLNELLTKSGLIEFINHSDTTESSIKWNTFRIRPANHPAKRVIQIFPLLYQSTEEGLIKRFTSDSIVYEKNSNKLIKQLKQILQASFKEYRYLDKTYKRPGNQLIQTILFNTILPILILYYSKLGLQDKTDLLWEAVLNYKNLPDNHIINKMKLFMTENQYKHLDKEILRQGVLKIYFDNCEYFACNACEKQKESLLLEL